MLGTRDISFHPFTYLTVELNPYYVPGTALAQNPSLNIFDQDEFRRYPLF